ncbi:Sulfite exporter TauE/SafE [Methyloligella halotolerans]|uniref:Probable membrane transporter protein n=1 Tax=Methyloligella halotolerans TaxID=1177755 RepID=A0A1E2RUT3_9HYPH|nr:sulfite exporter TauE/SafE family protein [Methyloligella halotolerans]ODA65912.1 Sulfite exporter TauE/SafE [Methyloligella halotolerans]
MTETLFAVCALGLVAGCLIGCIGVGGLIIVPVLVYGLGIPVHDAIGSALVGYILTGIIGTVLYARKGSIRWDLSGWLCFGAIPGVLLGAWLSNIIDPMALQIGIGLLTISAGMNGLFNWRPEHGQRDSLGAFGLGLIGFLAGVVSALTGTGGPLVVVPILLWCGMPALVAVGLSQAIQIPIAVFGTIGNFAFGSPDLSVGLVLALSLSVGAIAGANIAHVLPRQHLMRLASFILVIVGVAVLYKTLLT